jgi:hypothetical protein
MASGPHLDVRVEMDSINLLSSPLASGPNQLKDVSGGGDPQGEKLSFCFYCSVWRGLSSRKIESSVPGFKTFITHASVWNSRTAHRNK